MTATGTTVLVADDEQAIADALQGLLEDAGYTVVGVAHNGSEVITMVESLRPDVIIMDLRMPVMTGIEAATELRVTHPEIPVVILSAYEDAGLQLVAERIPVAAYLVKGCSSRMILQSLI